MPIGHAISTEVYEAVFGAAAFRTIDANERWYAVQCQPNRERTAAFHLANQGFSVFLPLREKTRRHARRIDTVRVPLFPGYLFVCLDLERARWRSVGGTVGVVRLVMHGERPTPAPRGVVEALIEACDSEQVIHWQHELNAGQEIRVINGPFAELLGQLESMTESGRLRVLLNIMGGQTPVVLPIEQVAAADSLL
jgi:transcriptional antiterminator RfaH